MLIILIIAIITLTGWLLHKYTNYDDLGGITMIFGGIGIVFCLIFIAVNHPVTHRNIQKYHSVKKTIEDSRGTPMSNWERAALTNTIIEWNANIAEAQYWNENIWTDIFWPDEVMELEPIK